jgi:hypothetical protein
MALQNFVDGGPPVISAAFLNAVDVFITTLFQGATTASAARTAIAAAGLTGDAAQVFAVAAAVGTDDAVSKSYGDTRYAKLAGLSSQVFSAGAATADAHVVNRLFGDARYAALAGLSSQAFTALRFTIASAAVLATATAGTAEYDGNAFYLSPAASQRAVQEISFLTTNASDFVGTDVATAQPVFEAARDTLSVAGGTTYMLEALYVLSRAAGTTSHTIATLFGGTATLTSIMYRADSTSTTGNALGATSSIYGTAASALVVTAASVVATENNIIRLRGIIRTNVAGTIIPQIQFSAAPGGAPTFKANSFFKLSPVGSSAFGSVGNWA